MKREEGWREVLDELLAENGVRQDDDRVIACSQAERAPVYLDDLAFLLTHANPVADVDGAFRHQGDAGEEAA